MISVRTGMVFLTILLIACAMSSNTSAEQPAAGHPGCVNYLEYLHWVSDIRDEGRMACSARYGDRIIAGSAESGISIYDVSDSSIPQLIGRISDITGPKQILMYKDSLIAVGASLDSEYIDRVIIVDIKDPAAPQIAGGLSVAYGSCFDIQGDLLYLGNGKIQGTRRSGSGLTIYDPCAPAESLVVGSCLSDNIYCHQIVVKGNHAYMATNEGVHIVDVSDPADPFAKSNFNPASNDARAICVVGDLAYISTGGGGVVVADVSDKLYPKQVSQFSYPPGSTRSRDNAINIQMSDSMLIVFWDKMIAMYDLSDPLQPKVNNIVPGYFSYLKVLSGSDRKIDVTTIDGIHLFEYPRSERVEAAATVPRAQIGFYPELLVEKDGIIYCLANKLGVVDCTTPTDPRPIGRLDMKLGLVRDADIAGDVLVAVSGNIHFIDVSDPSKSRVFHSIETPGHAKSVAVVGGHALVADGKRLQVVGLQDPNVPTIIGYLDSRNKIEEVIGRNGVAYIIEQSASREETGYVRYVDISDPAAPSYSRSIELPIRHSCVRMLDDLCLISVSSVVSVYDVTDASNPVEIHTFHMPPGACSFSIQDDMLVAPVQNEGVYFADLSDPGKPKSLGILPIVPAFKENYAIKDVVVAGGYLFVASAGLVVGYPACR